MDARGCLLSAVLHRPAPTYFQYGSDRLLIETATGFHCRLRSSHSLAVIEFAVSKFMFFCAQAQTPSGLISSCSKSAKSSSHHQCPLCPFAKIVFAPFSANEISPFIFSSRKTYTPLSFDCLAKPVNIYSNFFLIYFSQFFALGF